MKKKKVILSFDYELFFGDKSGTVQKSIIEPTYKILDTLDKVGAKGNFFVDWQMLKYLALEKDERCQSDYSAIVEQLKYMVSRGHRIELHIHPHWVDAKYNGDGTWDFSEFRHYSLSSFTTEEITAMFVNGTNLLEAIVREVVPSYKIIAFRAGGWAVQPFDVLKEGFRKAGIKIDSSVAIGAYGENQYSYYDFRNINTSSLNFYRFSEEVSLENKNGEFIEVPISTYHRLTIYKVFDKLFRLFFNSSKVVSDGTHSRSDLINKSKPIVSMVTLSKISPLSSMLSIIFQKQILVTVIDHPKDFTMSSISCIKFLSKFYNSLLYKSILE